MARTDRFTRLDQTRTALLRQRAKTVRRGARKAVDADPRTIADVLRLRTDYVTAIMGLRVASNYGREDLRPEYRRIADLLSAGIVALEFEDGAGI